MGRAFCADRGMSIVRLNVGGKVFTTTESTLTSQGGFFASLLAGDFGVLRVEDAGGDALFIDRSGEVFGHVLEFLRSGQVHAQDPETRSQILAEARFYLLDRLVASLTEDKDAARKSGPAGPVLRKDGFYLSDDNLSAWAFRPGGKIIHTHTTYRKDEESVLSLPRYLAGPNSKAGSGTQEGAKVSVSACDAMIVLANNFDFPDLWKDDEQLVGHFAKFVSSSILRGRYWEEDAVAGRRVPTSPAAPPDASTVTSDSVAHATAEAPTPATSASSGAQRPPQNGARTQRIVLQDGQSAATRRIAFATRDTEPEAQHLLWVSSAVGEEECSFERFSFRPVAVWSAGGEYEGDEF